MPLPADAPLLGRLLPLALGAAISPMVLIVQLLTLTAPQRGLRRSLAYLTGCTLVVLAWLAGACWISSPLPRPQAGPDLLAAALDSWCALWLALAGVWMLRQPIRPLVTQGHPGLIRPWLAGLAAMGSNLSSLVLFLPAIQEISQAGLSGPSWWSLVLATTLLTLLPAWLPPALVLAAGRSGRRCLERLAAWVVPRRRSINATAAFGLALLLLSRAAGRL